MKTTFTASSEVAETLYAVLHCWDDACDMQVVTFDTKEAAELYAMQLAEGYRKAADNPATFSVKREGPFFNIPECGLDITIKVQPIEHRYYPTAR